MERSKIRIKSNWFKAGREHTPEELAGAVSFVAWRIADNALNNTRRADFEIAVGPQYFAFLTEFLIYAIQIADRIAYRRLSAEDRATFTGMLANRVGDTYAENESRLLGGTVSECKHRFIEQLNRQADGYADFDYTDAGPSFNFTRYLGYCMDGIMHAKDSGWIIDQMITIEAPDAAETIEKTMRNLLETEPRPARRRSGTSGD
ncbi:MAG: hypothetical protein A2061_00300 [Gallionellales bacterium GWA2_59_43]|nr:MAG: hypothetical protein A2061_00300 [Gallionellales bacterium GWA2_59_43]